MAETSDPDETPAKPKGIRRFFAELRNKLWVAVLGLLVAGTLTYGERLAAWASDQVRASLRHTVETIVAETLRADLAETGDGAILRPAIDGRIETAVQPDGAISDAFRDRADLAISDQIDKALAPNGTITLAMADRIDAALNARVGAVIGGDFDLTHDRRTQELFFYLPENHVVEINFDVRGLRDGEIISLVSPHAAPGEGFAPIERNGPVLYQISGKDRAAEPRGEGSAGLRVQRTDRRITDDLVPVQIRLGYPEGALEAAATAEGGLPQLESNASVSFVALMTPPIRRDP